jgi:hypothetical protein
VLSAEIATAALFAVLALFILRRSLPVLMSKEAQLLWAWALFPCIGLLAVDLFLDTHTSLIARYALAGLPAGLLLIAMALSAQTRSANWLFVAALALAWSPALFMMIEGPPRPVHPFPEMAADIKARLGESDLVIVRSIPGGVVGLARYLDPSTLLASRAVRLHDRDPDTDMPALLRGRCLVALVIAHDLGDPSPQLDWLERQAKPVRTVTFSEAPLAEIRYFRPPQGLQGAKDCG